MSHFFKSSAICRTPLIGVFLGFAGALILISPLGRGQPGKYGFAPGEIPPAVQGAMSRLGANPDDPSVTLEVAKTLINQGRMRGNSEVVAIADNLLTSMKDGKNMAEALKYRAIAQQYLHEFDEALELLELSLSLNGNDPTALLTRANILLVQGRTLEAKTACRALAKTGRADLLLLCDTTAKALGPEALMAASRLNAMIKSGRMDPALTGYGYSVLGEIAMFQGDDKLAQSLFEKAQIADPENLRVRALHADSFLALGQPEAAINALDVMADTDALLVRRAIAFKLAGDAASLSRIESEFSSRVQSNLQEGHIGHAREEARYFLEVTNEPSKALERAKLNWKVQREFEDAWLLIDSARAANASDELDTVRSWMRAETVVAPELVSRLPRD